jgi:drug/metabolite transporter (DMT)-like permease
LYEKAGPPKGVFVLIFSRCMGIDPQHIGHDAPLDFDLPHFVNPQTTKNLPYALAIFCLAASMALVGSYVALSKPLVTVFPVFLLAWLRFGIGALAMPHWLKRPDGEAPLTGQIKRLIFLESLLGNFLFSIFMLYGMSLTSAVSAGVVMATLPAVVALMSRFFWGERMSRRMTAAVVCAGFGMILVSLSKQELPALVPIGFQAILSPKNDVFGIILLMGAVVCEAAYAVIGKKLTSVLTAKRITSLINLWGLVLMTPFGVYFALKFNFGAVPASTWLLLGFYGLAASVWSVWLWMTGLKTIPAARAGVFTVLLPVSTALTGVFLLGESVSLIQIAAFCIALFGLLLATVPE